MKLTWLPIILLFVMPAFAQVGSDSSGQIVILTSDNAADLAVAEAAAEYKYAEIFSIPWGEVDPATVDKIAGMNPQKVVIIGGTLAVPTEVIESFNSKGITVLRVWGEDRYETSAEAAKYFWKDSKTILMAEGTDSDAIEIVKEQSKEQRLPIIYTKSDNVPVAVKQTIQDMGTEYVQLEASPATDDMAVVWELGKYIKKSVSVKRANPELKVATNIARAEAKIVKTNEGIGTGDNVESLAAISLLIMARSKVQKAQELFEQGSYEEAYEHAIAAQALVEAAVMTHGGAESGWYGENLESTQTKLAKGKQAYVDTITAEKEEIPTAAAYVAELDAESGEDEGADEDGQDTGEAIAASEINETDDGDVDETEDEETEEAEGETEDDSPEGDEDETGEEEDEEEAEDGEAQESSSTIIIRDDDGSMEQHLEIDYGDDRGTKYLLLGDTNYKSAKLWVYAKNKRCTNPSNSHKLSVNGNPLNFNPCTKFEATYGWKHFNIPVHWLKPGTNSFVFTDYNTHWETTNLFVGVDQDNDYGRSIISTNVWSPHNKPVDGIKGELMAYLELGLDEAAENSAPTITLLYPTGGETLSKSIKILWEASDPDSDKLRIRIDYYDGEYHEIVGNRNNNGFYPWNTKKAPDGEYSLRIIATDGEREDTETSGYFLINNGKEDKKDGEADEGDEGAEGEDEEEEEGGDGTTTPEINETDGDSGQEGQSQDEQEEVEQEDVPQGAGEQEPAGQEVNDSLAEGPEETTESDTAQAEGAQPEAAADTTVTDTTVTGTAAAATNMIIKDHDDSREISMLLDYGDDYVTKYIDIDSLSGYSTARLWFYGRAGWCESGCPGTHRLQINSQTVIAYDPCAQFSQEYSWKYFDIPISTALKAGRNKFHFTDSSTHWTQCNILFAIDQGSAGENSIMKMNGAGLSGELMMHLEMIP